MVVATIWFVKTKIAKLTFVGFVLDPGNHMDLHGKYIIIYYTSTTISYNDYNSYIIFILCRYNCNRYDEEEAKAARDAQERSRAALQRYLFYCNRYMNHMQSLKFEHKLYASVKEKMEEMQQHNMSWIEVIEYLNMIIIL